MSPDPEPQEPWKSWPKTPGLLLAYPHFKPADGCGRPDPDTLAQFLCWTKLHFQDLLNLRVARDGTTLYAGAHLDPENITALPPIPYRITAQCRFNRDWLNELTSNVNWKGTNAPDPMLRPYIYTSNLQHIGIAKSQAFNELSRALDLGITRALNDGEKEGSVFDMVDFQMMLYKEVPVSVEKKHLFQPKEGQKIESFQMIKPARFNLPGCSTCLAVIKVPLHDHRPNAETIQYIQFLLGRELWDGGEHHLYTSLYRFVETLKDIPKDEQIPSGRAMPPRSPTGLSSQGGGSGQSRQAPGGSAQPRNHCQSGAKTTQDISTQNASSSTLVNVEGLRKFSRDFKVPYPLPYDLLPLLARDPVERNAILVNSLRMRPLSEMRANDVDGPTVEEAGRSDGVGANARDREDHHLVLFLVVRDEHVDVGKWRNSINAKVRKILGYHSMLLTESARDLHGVEWEIWDGGLFMGNDVPLCF